MRERQRRILGLFRAAQERHVAGDLAAAAQLYGDVLAVAPAHTGALHALGLLALQQGRSGLAIGYIGQAAKLQPSSAPIHLDLGRALEACGHLEEARAAFHVAALLAPEDAVAHAHLGAVLAGLGRGEEAAIALREAARLAPADPAAHNNLGAVLSNLGRAAEAEASLREAVRLQPEFGGAWNNLGIVTRAQGKLRQAAACFKETIRLQPDDADAWNNLGGTLSDLGQLDEAEAALHDALRLRPEFARALSNLGTVQQATDKLAEAEESFRLALRLDRNDTDIRNNLATLLAERDRPLEAEAMLREVLQAVSGHADAHFNLATTLLSMGRFAEGWPEFEWRLSLPRSDARHFDVPCWQGGAFDGTLLIHAEQGLGDAIQFCRYVTLAAQYGRVVLQAPPALCRLFATLEGPSAVVPRGAALPAFDWHCPLLSLPLVFGTTEETIPAGVSYLHAAAEDIAVWRERLQALPGLRVGLAWAGSPSYRQDRRRSVPADLLDPLSGVPGVSLVSLQKEASARPHRALHDWTTELHDFADTAALIGALDLVVTVDTAVAHLAGALGRPVWLLNRTGGDWRWLRDRDDSPWYPTLRQFRQTEPGDWRGVIADVCAALAKAPP